MVASADWQIYSTVVAGIDIRPISDFVREIYAESIVEVQFSLTQPLKLLVSLYEFVGSRYYR